MAGPVFIVSTGRCGSTMLSNMIRRHPDLLSISEFFSSLGTRAFRGGSMSGEAMFHRLNTLSPAGRALLRNGLIVDEFLYPLGPGARYRPEEVPPILCTTLPHLTDDHERVWDELARVLRPRGEHAPADHYRFVFDWLAERLGRKVWLERSGASLLFVPTLARLFPDARFVHIYRDGRETALSMRRHHYFRLRVQGAKWMSALGLDPFGPFNLPGTSPWMPAFEALRFRYFNAERYRKAEPGLPAFGWFWSRMVECGVAYLDQLPRERVLSLQYERVLSSPKEELSRFIRFVGPEFEHEAWLDEAAAMPRTRPPGWPSLAAEEGSQLARACQPGQEILGYDNGSGGSHRHG